MSLVVFEGWGGHAAIADMAYNDILSYGTSAIITAADSNGIGPRLGGAACYKGTSTGAAAYNVNQSFMGPSSHYNIWPRTYFKSSVAQGNSGVFGFNYFGKLTGNQVYAFGEAFFTPIGCVCDATGVPHFFIGIDANKKIVVYRWQNNPVNAYWNSGPYPIYNGQYGSLGSYGSVWGNTTDMSSNYWRYGSLVAAKFSLLGTSTDPIVSGQWNTIECKYVIDNVGTGGSIQLKVNKETTETTLDIDVANVRTSMLGTSAVGGIALGQFMGFVDNMQAQTGPAYHMGSLAMVTYLADFYWCNSTASSGANPFNSWLGPIQVKSANVDTLVGNTMGSIVGGSALLAVNGKLSAASLADYVQATSDGQRIGVKAASIAGETQTIIAAGMQIIDQRMSGGSRLFLGATRAGSTTEQARSILVTTAGHNIIFENQTSGAAWTPATLADTEFFVEQRQ